MLNFLVGESDGIAMLTSVILGALTVVLVLVVFGLVVENSKLQTGTFFSYCLHLVSSGNVFNFCQYAGKLTRCFLCVT